MNAVSVRRTSDERREEILEAAFTAFSESGFEGTSTDDIAAAVGISQPYLFRLFGTKKHLFLAAVERCFEETEAVFKAAADAGEQGNAKQRIGDAYFHMIQDGRKLRMQMQAYAACDDPDVRRVVQSGFASLVGYIQSSTGASSQELAQFLGQGMLLNVMAAMQVLDSEAEWAVTIREGCMGQDS